MQRRHRKRTRAKVNTNFAVRSRDRQPRESTPTLLSRFRPRVRRHAQTDVLKAMPPLDATIERARQDESPLPELPNFVTPFALADLAGAVLASGTEYRSSPVGELDSFDMCLLCADITEPSIHRAAGMERVRRLMSLRAYGRSCPSAGASNSSSFKPCPDQAKRCGIDNAVELIGWLSHPDALPSEILRDHQPDRR